MRAEDLLTAIGQVDDAHVRDARDAGRPGRRSRWKQWAAMAAVLAVAAGAGWTLVGRDMATDDAAVEHAAHDTVTEHAAYGFTMNGSVYFPISFADRTRYGLIPEGAVGLTPENTYEITEDDLGEPMGTVEQCGLEELVGAAVYHFAKFPELDSICIVEFGGEYAFYTADGLLIPERTGQPEALVASDLVLETYGIPDSVTALEIQNGSGEELAVITDREAIEAVCALLAGREDMGLEAHEKRYAQLWYDTYGNDDVYYDEAQSVMVYREEPPGEPETVVYDDGTAVTNQDVSTEVFDAAHALWGEGERVVWFHSDRGFRLCMIYTPSIGTFSLEGGFYALSPEETARMTTLLDGGS